MVSKGWAVTDSCGHLIVHTVSPTRRSTMVNYLVANTGVPITNQHTDDMVEQIFGAKTKLSGERLVRVDIKTINNQNDFE